MQQLYSSMTTDMPRTTGHNISKIIAILKSNMHIMCKYQERSTEWQACAVQKYVQHIIFM